MVSLRQPDGDVQVETTEAIKFIWWTGDIGSDLMGISYQTEFPNSLSSLRSYMDKVAGRRACSQKKTSLGMSRSCSSLSLLQYATVMFLSCHSPVLVISFWREKSTDVHSQLSTQPIPDGMLDFQLVLSSWFSAWWLVTPQAMIMLTWRRRCTCDLQEKLCTNVLLVSPSRFACRYVF